MNLEIDVLVVEYNYIKVKKSQLDLLGIPHSYPHQLELYRTCMSSRNLIMEHTSRH